MARSGEPCARMYGRNNLVARKRQINSHAYGWACSDQIRLVPIQWRSYNRAIACTMRLFFPESLWPRAETHDESNSRGARQGRNRNSKAGSAL